MYAFRTLLIILAFSLASAFAAPTHRRRSGRCRAASVSSAAAVSSALATSTAAETSTAVASSSTQPGSTEVASTPSSTSTHKASSSSHHATTTSAKPASASSSSDSENDGTTGLLRKLFPVAHISSWTTSTSSGSALPLNDDTLGVTKLLSALSHSYVTAPDGKKSMQAHYPEGSYTFGHQPEGGLSFYAKGPDNFNLDNAKEVTFSYSVLFEDSFDFNKGGKLPGVCECFTLLSEIFVPLLGRVGVWFAVFAYRTVPRSSAEVYQCCPCSFPRARV